MNLKMNYNAFIKLKDFFKLVDVSAEIEEYENKQGSLEGILSIKGKYKRRDNITEEYFLEKIPFTILMNTTDFEVEDINCIDFEFLSVDGRGIDVTFDIAVEYLVYEEIPVITETRDEMVFKNETIEASDIEDLTSIDTQTLEEEDYEALKKAETKRVDELLKSTLSYKDDNLPTDEVVIRGLADKKASVKVFYYKKEAELEKMCSNESISIDKVLKNNQKYEFNRYHRVIVNDK